jgi:putrescine transport system ATP-binding protein
VSRGDAQPLLCLQAVSKRFSGIAAVEDLSLEIYEGEFFALLGPSGCGKTTLLRMLAGFEAPDSGRILLDGGDLTHLPAHRRPLNMMFQSYALFPHLSVESNIAFGLRQERLSRSEIAARVAQMLTLVRLEGYGKRRPHQLSGGERQRVALARSLAKRPRLVLLDEPLAALDKKLRGETQFELMNLQQQLGLTFIIVTHDQQEAMTVADRMGVMHRGRLMQVATPPEIYERPSSRWVADFIGEVNLIEGRVLARRAERLSIGSDAVGELDAVASGGGNPGEVIWVALRPEKVRISRERPAAAGANCAAGRVGKVGYLGDLSIYQVTLDSGFVMKAALVNVTRLAENPIGRNERVWLHWPAEAAMVLSR